MIDRGYKQAQYDLDAVVGRLIDDLLEKIDEESVDLNLAPSETYKVLYGYSGDLADWYQDWYLDSGEEWT